MTRFAFPAALVALVLSAAAPGGAAAQVVTGKVVHAGTNRGMAEVAVRLRTPENRTVSQSVTDTGGVFYLRAPRPGMYHVVAERIGMEAVHSDELSVNIGQSLEILLRMSEDAVPLEPVVVQARSPYDVGFLSGYYERMKLNERTGFGTVISRDQIEERNPVDVSDMLRQVPRVLIQNHQSRGGVATIRSTSGECTPMVYINGALYNRREPAFVDDAAHVLDLEGIEVYIGRTQIPGEYYDDTGCGVILLWTRRSIDEGRLFSWQRGLMGLGAAVLLLFVIY